MSIALGTLFGVAGVFADSEVSRTTEASAASGATLNLTGALTILARSDNRAITVEKGLAASGGVGITYLQSSTTVSAPTRASIGSVVTGSASITVEAISSNRADTDAKAGSFGFVGSGAAAMTWSEITSAAETTATVGSSANLTISGEVRISADSTHLAVVDSTVGALSAGLSIAFDKPTAKVAAPTSVRVHGDITAGDVTVEAYASITSKIDSLAVQAGFFGGAGVAADALITSSADVSATVASSSSISAPGGTVKVSASYDGRSKAVADSAGINGVFGVAFLDAEAASKGDARTLFDGDLTGASLLDLDATSYREARSDLFVLSINGFAGGAAAFGKAETDGDTTSVLGANSDITATGIAIDIDATNVSFANGEATGGAGGILGAGAYIRSESVVGGTTDASVSGGAELGTAGARISSLDVQSSDSSIGFAKTVVGSGGAFSARGARSKTSVTPMVTASIGSDSSVYASGDIVVKARSVRAEADSDARSYGGGLVDIGVSDADSDSNPTAIAFLAVGTVIDAGGGVIVDAFADDEDENVGLGDGFVPSADDPDGNPVVDTTQDTIFFEQHRLFDGDVITYLRDGNPAIATRGGNTLFSSSDGNIRTYSVITIAGDPNRLKLGATFDIAQIDTGRDVITFDDEHSFQSGDPVLYSPNGNSDVVTGANTKYVRRIDDHTISLHSTLADALLPVATFDTGDVDSGSEEIDFDSDHGFSDGDLVTYESAPSWVFSGAGVDAELHPSCTFLSLVFCGRINTAGDPATPTYDGSQQTIYLGQIAVDDDGELVYNPHGLQDGQKVIYRVDEDLNTDPIRYRNDDDMWVDLPINQTYWVIKVNDWQVQLSFTDGGDPIELEANSGTNAYQHYLEPAAMGDLVNGGTYEVEYVDADTVKLRTPGGGIRDLYTSGIAGTHLLRLKGAELDLSGYVEGEEGASHELRIDLVGPLPGGTHRLMTVDEEGKIVSLRGFGTAAGDGRSDAVAKGGSGGLGAFGRPTADLDVVATVKAYSAATNVTAGGDISILARSEINTKSQANIGSGGLIKVSRADARTDVVNHVTAFVGNDFGSTGIGGESGSVQVSAAGMELLAGRRIRVASSTNVRTKGDASSKGGGFFDSSEAQALTDIQDFVTTVIGDRARLEAEELDFDAVAGGHQELDAVAFAIAFTGKTTARTTLDHDSRAVVLLEGVAGGTETRLFGWFGTDIRAYHSNSTYDLDSDSTCICIGPSPGPENKNTTLTAIVDADPGVAIVTAPRLLDGVNMSVGGSQHETRLVEPGQQGTPGDLTHLALLIEALSRNDIDANAQNRTVNWDADVVILAGPSPELLVGSDGRIVRAINVGVNGQFIPVPGTLVTGDINVDDLINDDPGDVVMQTDGGTVSGGQVISGHHWGTFEFRDNWDTVDIVNLSNKNLVINNIDVVNRTADPTVELEGSSITVDFDVERVVVPTVMEIINRSASELRINGTVDNPIGATLVQNDLGPIRATHSRDVAGPDGRVSLIRSNILHLEASASSMGTSGTRLNVDTVKWKGNSRPYSLQTDGDIHFTSYAYVDIWLDHRSRLRDTAILVTDVYTIDIEPFEAGDDIDVILRGTVHEVDVDTVGPVKVREVPGPTREHLRALLPGCRVVGVARRRARRLRWRGIRGREHLQLPVPRRRRRRCGG